VYCRSYCPMTTATPPTPFFVCLLQVGQDPTSKFEADISSAAFPFCVIGVVAFTFLHHERFGTHFTPVSNNTIRGFFYLFQTFSWSITLLTGDAFPPPHAGVVLVLSLAQSATGSRNQIPNPIVFAKQSIHSLWHLVRPSPFFIGATAGSNTVFTGICFDTVGSFKVPFFTVRDGIPSGNPISFPINAFVVRFEVSLLLSKFVFPCGRL
jgi:hypothetical protein